MRVPSLHTLLFHFLDTPTSTVRGGTAPVAVIRSGSGREDEKKAIRASLSLISLDVDLDTVTALKVLSLPLAHTPWTPIHPLVLAVPGFAYFLSSPFLSVRATTS